jgi:hypothetical protein
MTLSIAWLTRQSRPIHDVDRTLSALSLAMELISAS